MKKVDIFDAFLDDDGKSEFPVDVAKVVSNLIRSGDYWSFIIKDTNWYFMMHQLIKGCKGVRNDPEAVLAVESEDGRDYLFLHKDRFSALLISDRFNIPLPELEESTFIVLEKLEGIGSDDPSEPTVRYYGTA